LCFQLGGIAAESLRLVLADRMLKDLKLDSLSTLYYIAPPSFVLISFGWELLLDIWYSILGNSTAYRHLHWDWKSVLTNCPTNVSNHIWCHVLFNRFVMFEMERFPIDRLLGPFMWVLVLNGMAAFALNVSRRLNLSAWLLDASFSHHDPGIRLLSHRDPEIRLLSHHDRGISLFHIMILGPLVYSFHYRPISQTSCYICFTIW
jgi:hypothetical protein